MRLIDADELIKRIKEQKEKETGAYTKGVNSGLNIVKSILNDKTQTPTAYDIDKVVEELEKAKDGDCEHMTCEYSDECCYVDGLNKAIEIVKAGGKHE